MNSLVFDAVQFLDGRLWGIAIPTWIQSDSRSAWGASIMDDTAGILAGDTETSAMLQPNSTG